MNQKEFPCNGVGADGTNGAIAKWRTRLLLPYLLCTADKGQTANNEKKDAPLAQQREESIFPVF
ncbi:MAG: hypothetical protein AB7H80_05575 [Candidatus Kapaibacterium sp.]